MLFMFKPVSSKKALPEIEHEIFDFWGKEKIFEKSVENRQMEGAKKYVFFDGPPFANGLPHYGHLLANSLKDAVTRYFTMRGYYVPRVNGWDCHGLPVEYETEKELKISGRKDIEKLGVAKFNSECRKSVFRYTEEWEKTLKRLGRWVDFENSYATLDTGYMQSIWWVFKEIWNKKMVYQGYKSMHICPRCETPLSNFEVTLGYKDITEPSVILKFRLTDGPCKDAYILAWTTTPWTLPGNMFLALHENIPYVLVESEGKRYILAEPRLSPVFKDKPYKIIRVLKAEDMKDSHYEPLFPFYADRKDCYYVLLADFVTVEDGTGVVHIAPAFGEDDLQVGLREKVEPICHIKIDGTFVDEVTPWAGKFVKGQDLNIKDYLDGKGKLFHFENYSHSYPHCWRCDTPLLNYSTKAWFIRVTDIKDRLLKNNNKIHWVPEHIKEGRFGKWLENVRDWNISRNRFWGCPIPIWQCEKCGNQECIGSVKELCENSANGNTYIFVRHGEAENNALGIDNSDPKKVYHLTERGRKQIEKTAGDLKKEKADFLFASPFARTRESAEILSAALGVEAQFDQHLREHDMGEFGEQKTGAYRSQFSTLEERYAKKLPSTESFREVEARVFSFLDFLNRKYSNKKIVIVAHGDVVRAAMHIFGEKSIKEMFGWMPELGAITRIYAGKLPSKDGVLDLHKPYIDEIKLICEKCGNLMHRIPEVLDCWFESGSMPYAQLHYPFENKEEFEKNFPAHFIAEGLDQTRGWFYTLHVLSTILFDSPAFKNVIVNGILLAPDGEKLSKRKKNYPDPAQLFETYGVDTTRLFMFSSTAPLAEDVRFSEKHVEELVRNFTLTLWNTYSFFVTYANIDKWDAKAKNGKSKNKLDKWILSELNTLVGEVTEQMDEYNLTKAARPLIAFVDNLSNWYVRRSRRRFWKSENDSDKNQAYHTLYTVLITLCKLLAPFMPFTADHIYKNLTREKSVHLVMWPQADQKLINKDLNEEDKIVRSLVTLGHSIRACKNIKVRQPLAFLQIALPKAIDPEIISEYATVIAEELNVKRVELVQDASQIATQVFRPNPKILGPKYGSKVQEIIQMCKAGKYKVKENGFVEVGDLELAPNEGEFGFVGKEGFDIAEESGMVVALDTKITKQLMEEGYVREIVRNLQEMRKEAGYEVSDRIYVYIRADAALTKVVTQYADYIERETLAIEIQESGDFEWDVTRRMDVGEVEVILGVRK